MRKMIRNDPTKYVTRSKLVSSRGMDRKAVRGVKARLTLAAPIDRHFYIDFSQVVVKSTRK